MRIVDRKSTVDQIRERFDNDVERFSNLDTGQATWVDATLHLELITEAVAATNPDVKSLLDAGCGAGNYSLKLLQRLPGLDVTLIDLSRPMLDRAVSRITPATTGSVRAIQGDIREVLLPSEAFDVVVSGAAIHHLRDDGEWHSVFSKLFQSMRPGGTLWIADFIAHSIAAIDELMFKRWCEFLVALGGEELLDRVVRYVEAEDTPRSVTYQLDLMRSVGFKDVEILHKNSCFAAFGGRK